MKQANKEIYFQQQGFFSLQCGLHSVNHLLGRPQYNKQTMNDICYTLSDNFINPHKHIFGGDYDVNVLIIALQKNGCQCKWHDHRKQIKIQKNQDILGYLINVNQQRKFYHKILGMSGRHWIIAKLIRQIYYIFDSSKTEPMTISQVMEQKENNGAQISLKKIRVADRYKQQIEDYFNTILKQEGQILIVYKTKKQK